MAFGLVKGQKSEVKLSTNHKYTLAVPQGLGDLLTLWCLFCQVANLSQDPSVKRLYSDPKVIGWYK